VVELKKFLIDIDGVLFCEDHLIEGADDVLKRLEERGFNYVLVTNVSRMSVQMLVDKLAAMGLKVDANRLLTAISATADYIKNLKAGAKCYLIAPPEADSTFQDAGLTVTRREEPVDFVVVGYDRDLTFEKLDIAFRLIRKGAKLIAMNEDKLFPGKAGASIGPGAFVKGLEYVTGKKAVVIGKPSRNFFKLSLKKIAAKAEETAMVGDSLSSDIIGAKKAGLTTIMVQTGAFNREELNESKMKPDYLIPSIKELLTLI
jgi:HAD superfamily hydrolase (TIGR01450 family)